MKRLLLLLIIPILMGAAPTRQFSYTAGTTIEPTEVIANEDAIFLYLQAGIDTYRSNSITGSALATNISISSSGNMIITGTTNLSGTANLSGTFQLKSVEVTSSAAELNKLDGISTTATELGYVNGVTSSIQTQLNNKASKGSNSDITSLTGLTTALGTAYGGTGSVSTTYCSLTSNVSGILPEANGGTGTTSAARIKIGSYTGNGAATQSITGVGFQPSAVLILRADGSSPSLSLSLSTNDTFIDQNASTTNLYAGDHIRSFDVNGFTVGDGTGSSNIVNVNSITYKYIAFKE